MKKSIKSLAVALASTCTLASYADNLSVGAGTTHTVSSNEEYGTVALGGAVTEDAALLHEDSTLVEGAGGGMIDPRIADEAGIHRKSPFCGKVEHGILFTPLL